MWLQLIKPFTTERENDRLHNSNLPHYSHNTRAFILLMLLGSNHVNTLKYAEIGVVKTLYISIPLKKIPLIIIFTFHFTLQTL